MAIPRGMFLRGRVWWCRKDVPKPLQQIDGQTSLQRTLGTGDVEIARSRFHRVMAEFEDRIAQARARLAGLPVEPAAPMQIMIPKEMMWTAPPTGPKMPAIVDQWAKHRQPTRNTFEEARRIVGQFMALNGYLVMPAYPSPPAHRRTRAA
jgi:hypothetical protein